MRVSWTPRALRDLREIGAYIRRDNSEAARRWIDRLLERGERTADAPRAGRIVPEVQREDIREVFLKSYRIVSQLRRDEIAILTVFEGHRLFPPLRIPPPERD
jgi:toxin ParE1/3/4